jgi:hypothetical protein
LTNEQLYIIVGAPVLFNAVLIGLLMAYVNAKFDGLAGGMNERFRGIDRQFESIDRQFESIDRQFESIDRRFDSLDRRFDDMRDLWRSELHRVEEVIDARLKHLELR